MKFKTVIYLVLLGAIWGSSFLFQRITVPEIGAGLTALRTGAALVSGSHRRTVDSADEPVS